MIRQQWARVRQEWRQNRRLRVGGMIVVLILGTHGLLRLADARKADAEQLARDAALLRRFNDATRETAWPKRNRDVRERLKAVEQSIPGVRSDGAARADAQAWLTQLATDAVLAEPRVRIETSIDIDGHPDMLQVMGRLDGTVPRKLDLAPLVRGLSAGLPWRQVEMLEIGEAEPVQVAVILRNYYRRDPMAQVPPAPKTAAAPDVALPKPAASAR